MQFDSLLKLASDNILGALWYDSAIAEISEVCGARGWNADKFTAILAVTSPRVSVRRNVRMTLHYMQTGEFLANTMAAIRQSVATYNDSGRILGPKTEAFYRALRGDCSAVVLDVHMANLFGCKQTEFSKAAKRQEYAELVTAIAAELEIAPRDCQAALWCGQVRASGRKPEAMPIRQEFANLLAQKQFPQGKISQFGCIDGKYQHSLFDNAA